MENWHLLTTLYGSPGKPTPLLSVLSKYSTSLVYGLNAEDMKAVDGDEGLIRDTAFEYEFKPHSYAVFGTKKVAHLDVPTRRSTLYHWHTGQFIDGDEQVAMKSLLNLNAQEDDEATNYKGLISKRVISTMSGKWCSALAYLGFQNTFILSAKAMPLYGWLIYYCNTYYMLFSSAWDTAKKIEEYTLENLSREVSGTYYHQSLEIPPEPLLVLRPVYMTGKFRRRITTYSDRSSSKLLVCNYIRRYVSNLSSSQATA